MQLQSKFTNWRRFWTLWLVLLIAFAYPIQAFIPVFLKLPSTPINAAFRAFYALLASVLILSSFPFKIKLLKGVLWLLLFWGLYLIRLVYDISFRNISFGDKSDLYIYSMVFGNIVLPITAIILNAKYINVRNIFYKLFGIILAGNILLLIAIILQNGGISAGLFLDRVSVTGLNEDELVVNTITIGFYGNLLFAISFFALIFLKKLNRFTKIIFIASIILGLFILVLAASRGPFLVMLFLIIYLLYFKYKFSISKFGYLLKAILITVILYFCVEASGIRNNLSDKFALFSRLSNFEQSRQKGETESRDDLFSEAWKQFLSNPVVGDQWVTRAELFYPHNIFLEVLMAMGLIGIIIFILIYIEVIKRIILIIKRKEVLILPLSLVLIAQFLRAMTSGSVVTSMELWVLTALFLSVSFNKINA